MYEDLTGIQIKIFEFIRDELSKRGYPPSVREIGETVGLSSTSSVHHQLSKLEEKGYIRRDRLKPRAIEILKLNPFASKNDIVEVPLIGTIAAGNPITAFEDYEQTFPLPADFIKNNTCFMLMVKGNSMVEAGIYDGDYVIIRQQSSAINGEIVAALIEDEATIKTFYKEEDGIRLQPENPTMEPIFSKNVTILGIVIGLFRKFE
jgi:repressor LexA